MTVVCLVPAERVETVYHQHPPRPQDRGLHTHLTADTTRAIVTQRALASCFLRAPKGPSWATLAAHVHWITPTLARTSGCTYTLEE